MSTKRKKVVKLAARGQLRGFPVPSQAEEDYTEAADLAEANPRHPVIVHEYGFNASDQEVVRKEVATVVKLQMAGLNSDKGGERLNDEPFHVGYALDADVSVYRTVVVFYPDGRPRRTRRSTTGPSALGLKVTRIEGERVVLGPNDPPLPPEDDPDAPRATGSHFVYPPVGLTDEAVASVALDGDTQSADEPWSLPEDQVSV